MANFTFTKYEPPVGTATFDVSIVNRTVLQVAPEPVKLEVSNWVGWDATGPGVGETRDNRLLNIEIISVDIELIPGSFAGSINNYNSE